MGRRKIQIAPITDERNRSVTFNKRRGGLFKKAYELGVLCGADIAVIVFSPQGKCYEYSSGNLDETLLRYSRMTTPPTERKGPADFGGSVADSARTGAAGNDDDDEGESEEEKAPTPVKPTAVAAPEAYDFNQMQIPPGYPHGAFAPYYQPNMAYPAFPGYYPNPYAQALPVPPGAPDVTAAATRSRAGSAATSHDVGGANATSGPQVTEAPRAASMHPGHPVAAFNNGLPYPIGLPVPGSAGFDSAYTVPDFFSGPPPGRLSAAVAAGIDDFSWPTYAREERAASTEPLPAPTESSTHAPVSLERKRPATEEPDGDPEEAKRRR